MYSPCNHPPEDACTPTPTSLHTHQQTIALLSAAIDIPHSCGLHALTSHHRLPSAKAYSILDLCSTSFLSFSLSSQERMRMHATVHPHMHASTSSNTATYRVAMCIYRMQAHRMKRQKYTFRNACI